MRLLTTVLVYLLTLISTAVAQTALISPQSSLRNGGFEDADGSDFSSIPFWENYFAEGANEDPVLNSNPNSGLLRSFANGFQDSGIRIHPSQIIPSADWTIEAGDVFTASVSARNGVSFDIGADRLQMIIHVVDTSGNPVADLSSPTGFSDRVLSGLGDVPTAHVYHDFSFTSEAVPAGSPWIGQQVQIRILHDGTRSEFLMLDDVSLVGYRAAELIPEPILLASYQADGNPADSGPSSLDGIPGAGFAYGPGFGSGSSFDTSSGNLGLPISLPSSFSIAFWLKTPNPGSEGTQLNWNEGSALIDGSPDWGLSLRGNQLTFGIANLTLSSQSFVAGDRWHHIAVTRNDATGNHRLYIDGQLEDSEIETIAWSGSPDIRVGAARGGDRTYSGLIDDLRLYSGVLGIEDLTAVRIGPGDIDGDGFSDAEEADAGTDWGTTDDFPKIAAITHESGEVHVEVEGKRSRQYQLERHDELTDTTPDAIPDLVTPLESESPLELTDSDPPQAKAFYRVRAEKGPLPQPNILLIVGDDHGYADISAYPNARPDISTPSLDRLATAGSIFTQAYVSSPVCSPSRCGYLTGRYQNEWDPAGGWAPRLPGTVKHIAEYLKEAGYATAMIGKNDFGQPVGSIDNRDHPTNHGFDRFFGFNAHAHDFWLHSQAITDSVQPAWPTEASAHLGKFINTEVPGNFETAPDGKWQTELFTDRAIDYLEERKDQAQPFFLYLSHASVHALIHQAPKSYLDAEGVPELPLYDPATNTPDNPSSYNNYYYNYSRPTPQDPNGMISDTDMRKYYRAHLNAYDDQMGRLLDALQAKGLSENTIVIYFSDNGGEALTGANNQPLSGSKYNTFEGGLRVPMMISWPGRIPGGQVYTHVTSTLDVVPTLLDIAGVENAAPLSGHSLIEPLKKNESVVPGERTLFWRFNDQWAIRKGDWKLVLGKKNIADKHTSQIVFNDAALNKVALFNLAVDPSEMNDLADSTDPAIQAIKTDLQARYNAWQSSL